ncbi:WXG100 family type VII secretion target [Paenibacillus turicensis]|uniref:ESAT-6-like protein n=1 Tax=Paenibacillus turicensis TaxID=160487 RepID=A0ABS4FLE6_9BACL|nr:WXG100 family type VII secretion target [Paenibacillus turicensis]MBP1903395.1 WXG100 family type VII secretion target [Paenibacillus turicensis]
MSKRIKIDPDHLNDIGKKFIACSEKNIAMAQELKGLIEGLNGQWEGNTKERFHQAYQDADQQLTSVSTVLQQVGEELNAIAERFKIVDESTYSG